jgi:hypothetical protein
VHRREWELAADSLRVSDTIEGPGNARSFWHWAPGVDARTGPRVALASGFLGVTCDGAALTTAASTWHPEFGLIMSNDCSCAEFSGRSCNVRLDWT